MQEGSTEETARAAAAEALEGVDLFLMWKSITNWTAPAGLIVKILTLSQRAVKSCCGPGLLSNKSP
jgi:hypothetical protein